DRTGNRESLSLSSRKAHAPLSQKTCVAIGKPLDELRCVGGLASGEHFGVARVWTPIADVFKYARRENDRILRNDCQAPAHFEWIGCCEIDAVDSNRAPLRIIESQQQCEHRRLAGTRWSNQRNLFPRCNAKRKI